MDSTRRCRLGAARISDVAAAGLLRCESSSSPLTNLVAHSGSNRSRPYPSTHHSLYPRHHSNSTPPLRTCPHSTTYHPRGARSITGQYHPVSLSHSSSLRPCQRQVPSPIPSPRRVCPTLSPRMLVYWLSSSLRRRSVCLWVEDGLQPATADLISDRNLRINGRALLAGIIRLLVA